MLVVIYWIWYRKPRPSKVCVCYDLLNLISEAKAEVVEVIEDLTEDEDIKEMKVRVSPDLLNLISVAKAE